ncbi:MAG: O-antigen ligase family protein [bacterium]
MWKQRIERALIIALGLLVAAGAALLGGVHPVTQLWLSGCALSLLGLCIAWRTLKRGALTVGAPFWVLAGLTLVCLAQLGGLSPEWHQTLQPRGAALAAYSTEGLGALWHRCLSLDPPATALECCKLVGLASIAAAAALLARDRSRALLLLWTVDLAGLSLGLLAAVQLVLGADSLFWLHRPEQGGQFMAPFVNANHAGGFYGALLFLHLGLALQVREQRRRWVLLAVTALPALLVVASASRGAIAATALGGLGFLVLLWRAKKLTRRQLGYGLAITIILGTVAFPASETIRNEFGRGTRWEAVDEEYKLRMWGDAVRVARDYPLTGVGRGAFRSVYPKYFRVESAMRSTYSYAENIVVQLLAELGPVVFGVLLLFVVLLGFRYLRGTELELIHVTALLPVLVLLGQNLVDFNLEFPGTGFLFVVLLGVLAGLRLGSTRRVVPRGRRFAHAGVWLGLVALGGVIVVLLGSRGVRFDLRTEGDRLRNRLNRGGNAQRSLSALRAAIRRHPADYYLHYLAGVAALRVDGEQPLRHLNRSLYLNPRSGPTHHLVGRALRRLGFARQALTHYTAAITRGVPVQGRFARELYALLSQLWAAQGPQQALAEASWCYGALATTGQPIAVGCALALRLALERRGESIAAVARADLATAVLMAKRLEQQGRDQQALVAYEQLLTQHPGNAELLGRLASLSLRNKDLALAMHWSRAALRVERNAGSYARLSGVYRAAGRHDLGEKTADEGLARYPTDVSLVALKAEALLARGAVESARALLREQTVGKSLEIGDELRLLRLRLQIEKLGGNLLRQERLKSRMRQLQRLLRAGARGRSIQH